MTRNFTHKAWNCLLRESIERYRKILQQRIEYVNEECKRKYETLKESIKTDPRLKIRQTTLKFEGDEEAGEGTSEENDEIEALPTESLEQSTSHQNMFSFAPKVYRSFMHKTTQ